MSQAHKAAALKRASKYPKGFFSGIASKRQSMLTVDQRKANSRRMHKAKKGIKHV